VREREKERERERDLSKHYIDFGGDAVTRRSWLNMNDGCTFVWNQTSMVSDIVVRPTVQVSQRIIRSYSARRVWLWWSCYLRLLHS